MYQKMEEIEKPYSKKEIVELKKHFKELEKFRDSPEVMAYIKKRQAELKGQVL